MFTNKDYANYIIDDIEYNPTYLSALGYTPLYVYIDNHRYLDTDLLFNSIRLERFIRSMYIIALEAFI